MQRSAAHALQLLSLGVATPEVSIDQRAAADAAMTRCAFTDAQRQKVQRIFSGSGISRRGCVIATNGDTPRGCDPLAAAYPAATSPEDSGPPIGDRMRWYERDALPLASLAARRALDEAGVDVSQITQLVTVSCTGFVAPGVDLQLMNQLGIPRTAARTAVGFMGCHGALNGLRITDALARTQPDHHVLLCCVELCSLHFQYGHNAQHIVANALFADGAAAAVGAAGNDDTAMRVIDQASIVVPDSEDAMTWTIRDHGFEMTLSVRVPRLIEQHLPDWLNNLLASHGLTATDIAGWAVHPGGPKILSAVEDALHLPSGACDVSRAVLAEHGNMSSPTVLFILDRLRHEGIRGPVVMLAFGPGLVVEAALLQL